MLHFTPHCRDRLVERDIDTSSAEAVAIAPFISRSLGTGRRAVVGPGRDNRGCCVWVLVVVERTYDDVGITAWRPKSLPGSALGRGGGALRRGSVSRWETASRASAA